MKPLLLLLLSLPALLLPGCVAGDANELNREKASVHAGISYERTKQHARAAKAFCLSHHMDTQLCLLADMQVHSGKRRLVVWDFTKDTLMASGLVSHGCGRHSWGKDGTKDRPVFSNQPDSHCSSLGKYRIGERGASAWGIHVKYLMYGLEASNSNALRREVVLHGWEAIPDQEVYPDGTPEGWGCPAVSNQYMKQLDRMLRKRGQPVLLWIYP